MTLAFPLPMMSLLDFPLEILLLVVEILDFHSFSNFCNTNQYLRQTFQIRSLNWLLQKPPGSRQDEEYEKAIKRLHYISRSHLLLLMLYRDEKRCELDYLTERGATLKHAPSGLLIRHRFLEFGASASSVQFMLQNGGSLYQVPGGIHQLVQDTCLRFGESQSLKQLLKEGGSLLKVPWGIDKLIEYTIRKYGFGRTANFLIAERAKICPLN